MLDFLFLCDYKEVAQGTGVMISAGDLSLYNKISWNFIELTLKVAHKKLVK